MPEYLTFEFRNGQSLFKKEDLEVHFGEKKYNLKKAKIVPQVEHAARLKLTGDKTGVINFDKDVR